MIGDGQRGLPSYAGRPRTAPQLVACEPVDVTMADGHMRRATTSGTAFLAVPGGTRMRELQLKHVLLVPGLAVSLFSVRQLASAGYSVEFGEHATMGKHGVFVARGVAGGRSYILGIAPGRDRRGRAFTAMTMAAFSAEIWHRRPAHLATCGMSRSAGTVRRMTRLKFDLDDLLVAPCVPCIKWRMTRDPIPRSTSRTTKPLQLLHTDVAGTMSTVSAGGCS